MYTEQNPHPDIKYVETKEWITPKGKTAKTVWFQCRKCKKYMHSLKHFGWACPNCQDDYEEQKQKLLTDAFNY
jgi:tRNA(Ile2) C34 agmatinyltransferase TiaS